jgi:hypothetical protein
MLYNPSNFNVHVHAVKFSKLEENHTHKFFDNHYSWLWNDSTTRFWICSRLSQRRDIQAGVALLKEMKKRAPLPKSVCPRRLASI